MFGCFLVLESYRVWLASDGLRARLELHIYFAAGSLPPHAFEYGRMLLKDCEKFVLLGHAEVCTFLRHCCLEIMFLIGYLLEAYFGFDTSCSVSPPEVAEVVVLDCVSPMLFGSVICGGVMRLASAACLRFLIFDR